MHEIGKDIAITMLRAGGFEVHDLGRDVNALDFVRRAEEVHADIIGASALMTTTMPAQKEIVDILVAKGAARQVPRDPGRRPGHPRVGRRGRRRQLGRGRRQRGEDPGEGHGRQGATVGS